MWLILFFFFLLLFLLFCGWLSLLCVFCDPTTWLLQKKKKNNIHLENEPKIPFTRICFNKTNKTMHFTKCTIEANTIQENRGPWRDPCVASISAQEHGVSVMRVINSSRAYM